MKKNILISLKAFLGIGMPLFVMYECISDGISAHKDYCKTVKMALRNIIIDYGGNTGEFLVLKGKDGSKIWGVRVGSLTQISIKGFKSTNEIYGIHIGDSIIKEANSKLITFKRGDSTATYELDCNCK